MHNRLIGGAAHIESPSAPSGGANPPPQGATQDGLNLLAVAALNHQTPDSSTSSVSSTTSEPKSAKAPPPSSSSASATSTREQTKDDGYWRKRHRNNEAAKKSRAKRKQQEVLLQAQLRVLAEENSKLQSKLHGNPTSATTPTETAPPDMESSKAFHRHSTGSIGDTPVAHLPAPEPNLVRLPSLELGSVRTPQPVSGLGGDFGPRHLTIPNASVIQRLPPVDPSPCLSSGGGETHASAFRPVSGTSSAGGLTPNNSRLADISVWNGGNHESNTLQMETSSWNMGQQPNHGLYGHPPASAREALPVYSGVQSRELQIPPAGCLPPSVGSHGEYRPPESLPPPALNPDLNMLSSLSSLLTANPTKGPLLIDHLMGGNRVASLGPNSVIQKAGPLPWNEPPGLGAHDLNPSNHSNNNTSDRRYSDGGDSSKRRSISSSRTSPDTTTSCEPLKTSPKAANPPRPLSHRDTMSAASLILRYVNGAQASSQASTRVEAPPSSQSGMFDRQPLHRPDGSSANQLARMNLSGSTGWDRAPDTSGTRRKMSAGPTLSTSSSSANQPSVVPSQTPLWPWTTSHNYPGRPETHADQHSQYGMTDPGSSEGPRRCQSTGTLSQLLARPPTRPGERPDQQINDHHWSAAPRQHVPGMDNSPTDIGKCPTDDDCTTDTSAHEDKCTSRCDGSDSNNSPIAKENNVMSCEANVQLKNSDISPAPTTCNNSNGLTTLVVPKTETTDSKVDIVNANRSTLSNDTNESGMRKQTDNQNTSNVTSVNSGDTNTHRNNGNTPNDNPIRGLPRSMESGPLFDPSPVPGFPLNPASFALRLIASDVNNCANTWGRRHDSTSLSTKGADYPHVPSFQRIPPPLDQRPPLAQELVNFIKMSTSASVAGSAEAQLTSDNDRCNTYTAFNSVTKNVMNSKGAPIGVLNSGVNSLSVSNPHQSLRSDGNTPTTYPVNGNGPHNIEANDSTALSRRASSVSMQPGNQSAIVPNQISSTPGLQTQSGKVTVRRKGSSKSSRTPPKNKQGNQALSAFHGVPQSGVPGMPT